MSSPSFYRRFELRNWLCAWSSFLAVFSIAGTLRTWVIVWYMYSYHGIYGIICHAESYIAPIGSFWAIAFTLSKFVEFGK